MDGVLFEFDEVALERGGHHLLRGATGWLADHEMTVVVGPSGAGKSTLLRLCNRLDVASAGTVRYAGRPIDAVDPRRLRREVGMVFQRPVALPGTVADNLRAGAGEAGDAAVEEVLARVGLPGLAERDAGALSGGEAQRMCLARTLLTGPRALLMDEPTAALDTAAAADIEDLARELAADGVPTTWVTHDLAQMSRLAHHLVVLIDGRIAQQGHLAEVLASPSEAVGRFLAGGRP